MQTYVWSDKNSFSHTNFISLSYVFHSQSAIFRRKNKFVLPWEETVFGVQITPEVPRFDMFLMAIRTYISL